jgi:hypothetical protein
MAPSLIPTGVIVRQGMIRRGMVACETCTVREGMRVAVVMGECVRVDMSVSPAAAVPTTPGITQR